jgi:hypothetical protein
MLVRGESGSGGGSGLVPEGDTKATAVFRAALSREGRYYGASYLADFFAAVFLAAGLAAAVFLAAGFAAAFFGAAAFGAAFGAAAFFGAAALGAAAFFGAAAFGAAFFGAAALGAAAFFGAALGAEAFFAAGLAAFLAGALAALFIVVAMISPFEPFCPELWAIVIAPRLRHNI